MNTPGLFVNQALIMAYLNFPKSKSLDCHGFIVDLHIQPGSKMDSHGFHLTDTPKLWDFGTLGLWDPGRRATLPRRCDLRGLGASAP